MIPELEHVSLASNNPDNSTAMAGDNVTLTVRSREALQTLELVHEDDTLESLTPIGGDGKQWAYSREIQPGETGPVNFLSVSPIWWATMVSKCPRPPMEVPFRSIRPSRN